ncbi:uncharacterized protein LOC143007874 [Genypterus blacodes]|uniref:uncharacterized protein LOC143007874 n=1 Tax=Genypterus blacodes TaxID=154954 RepID=UPI003F76F66C
MSSKPRVKWTLEMEGKLVELWQENECLFDVSSKEFHIREEKEKRWAAIAAALGRPVNEVKTRATSLRTQFTRLLKPKSGGSGDTGLTPKQIWILEMCDFLKPHVTSRSTDTGLDPAVVAQLDESYSEREDEDLESVDSDASHQSAVDTPAIVPPSSITLPVNLEDDVSATACGTSTLQHSPAPKRRRVRPPNDLQMQTLQVLKEVAAAATKEADDAEIFANLVANELRKIQDPEKLQRVKAQLLFVLFDSQGYAPRFAPSQPVYNPSPYAWPQAGYGSCPPPPPPPPMTTHTHPTSQHGLSAPDQEFLQKCVQTLQDYFQLNQRLDRCQETKIEFEITESNDP